jgi:predicted MPP superfamily phosphohydrolase
MAQAEQNPDLFVHLGDVVHARHVASYKTFNRIFRRIFPRTPLLAVVGNHDLAQAMTNDLDLVAPASKMAEKDVLSCRLTVGGWELFSIDAKVDQAASGSDHQAKQQATLDWLEGELQSLSPQARAIICTHFPIIALERDISGYPPTEFGLALARLLRKYSDRIKLVMHGHIHHGAYYSDSSQSSLQPPLRFRSALCASYPLTQSTNQASNAPIFDRSNPFGYERLQLPESCNFTLTPTVLGPSNTGAG